jgi:uncharacterized protein (TIGR00297 family)
MCDCLSILSYFRYRMFISTADSITAAVAIAIIAVTLICCEWAVKAKLLSQSLGRKLLHITAICTCAWAMYRFENTRLLAGVFFFFFVVLLLVIRRGWLQVSQNKSYGIAFFPLAFGILLLVPQFDKNIVLYAMLTLGISDAAAGLAGERWGRNKIRFLHEEKSWAGFTAFFISQVILCGCMYGFMIWNLLLLGVLLATLPALTELFSYKGSDNLTVPLFAAYWLWRLEDIHPFYYFYLFPAVAILAFLADYSAHLKWLTVSGAAAAAWMGLLLMTGDGFRAFFAPGLFLVSGALLSKLNKPAKEKEGRDALQVFSNGITGIVCLCAYALTKDERLLMAFCCSFAIAMADSVSSEMGVFFKGKTIDITTLKKSQPGMSGGISWQGTLAGLGAALLLALFIRRPYEFTISQCILIAAVGFAGMLADSVLGSLLQRKYRLPDGRLAEDPEPDAVLVKGVAWCDNNMVNLLSNGLATGLYIAAVFVFW